MKLNSKTRYRASLSGFLLFLFYLVLCTAALNSISCQGNGKKKEEDEKRDEGQRPETKPEVNLPPGGVKPIDQLHLPDSPAGKAILEHISTMYSLGPETETNYQKSLAGLRKNAKEIVAVLVSAYERADVIAYGDRWTVLQTLADLEVPEALGPLLKFAKADLPMPDTSQHDDAVSLYSEESILKVTAIDGIAKLTKTNDRALREITFFFNHKDAGIRLEAMNRFGDAIRTTRDPKKQETMIKLFPKGYTFELRPEYPAVPGVVGDDKVLKPSGKGKGKPPKI